MSQVDNLLIYKGDPFPLNLMIQPDQFPDGISWLLQDNNNRRVIGGRLSNEKTNEPNSEQLDYSRCLDNNTHCTFHIHDNYGDGVCCDLGDRNFIVEWNNKQVLDGAGFQSSKVICLPQSDNLIPLGIEIGNFQPPQMEA